MKKDWYLLMSTTTAVLVFVSAWVYLIDSFRELGALLGWIPALILGTMARLLWPLVILFVTIAAILKVSLIHLL